MSKPRTNVVTTDAKLRALFTNRAVYETADLIPPWRGGSRRRNHPDVMAVFYLAMVPIFGSIAKVEAALNHDPEDPGSKWQSIRRWYQQVTGEVMPNEPYRWFQFVYMRDNYLLDVIGQLRAVLRRQGLIQAHMYGDYVEGAGSFNSPSTLRTIIGDGTVIPSLTKSATSLRADPTAQLHWTMGGLGRAQGNMHVFFATASNGYGSYVLDTCAAPERGSEMRYAEQLIDDIFHDSEQLFSGLLQSVTYDGLLNPERRNKIMRVHGAIPIVRTRTARDEKEEEEATLALTALAAVLRNLSDEEAHWRYRIACHILTYEFPKEPDMIVYPIAPKRAGVEVDIEELGIEYVAMNGQPVALERNVIGEPVLMESQPRRTRVHRRGKNGQYRFYSEWIHPTEHGDLTFTIRHHHEETDRYMQSGLFSLVHREHELYDHLNGKRSNIENVNSIYKSTLHKGRANTLGAERQSLMAIGWAFAHNAEVTYKHQRAGHTPRSWTATDPPLAA